MPAKGDSFVQPISFTLNTIHPQITHKLFECLAADTRCHVMWSRASGLLVVTHARAALLFADTLDEILKFLHTQNQEGTPWSFKIHRKTLNIIRSSRCV